MSAHIFVGFLFFFGTLVMPIKYLTHRSRPKHIPSVRRYLNMRAREGNQPSHPSGDSAVAAYFGGVYHFVFRCSLVYPILTPAVMFGRVYMQCHWFGDTIVGAILGTFWGILWYSDETFAYTIGPFLKLIFQ